MEILELSATPKLPHLSTFINPITYNDTMSVSAREWLIDDWIPSGVIGFLHGEGGSGKTNIALKMSLSVLYNDDFFGHATKQGDVLFLSFEEDKNEICRRLQSIIKSQHYNSDIHKERLKNGFTYLNLTTQPKNNKSELTDILIDKKPSLVVIDSFRLWNPGCDENSSTEGAAVIADILKIVYESGIICSTLILHHNSKAGKYRGTTAIHAHARYMISAEKHSDELFEIKLTKSNYSKTGTHCKYRSIVTDYGYKMVLECDEVSNNELSKLTCHIKNNKGLLMIKPLYFEVYGKELKSGKNQARFTQKMLSIIPSQFITKHNNKTIKNWDGIEVKINGYYVSREWVAIPL
jgi:RecA-family ATPase